MLCADFFNIPYKLKINRTFIEHKKNSSIKKSKKCTYINMEVEKKIDPLGFREYDARWLYPKSINSKGIEAVGKGFGTQVISSEKDPIVIVGNDYRSYSEEVKNNFSFENFIINRIKYDLPNYLVENFDKIIRYVKNLNFHQKYIVTGGDHFYNILFKFWMAFNKDKESKILTLDHGIHNGVEKGDIYYQEEIGDINIGFYKQMKSKEIQLPSIRLSKYIDLREKKSKPEKLLFVSYDSMIYPENILISPICSKSKYVIEYFETLTKYLDSDILSKTLIRPTFKKHYPFSWVKDEMIHKFSKKFKIAFYQF